MLRRLAAMLGTVAVLGALACSGGEEPPPPSPVVNRTPETTPTATLATATPSQAVSPNSVAATPSRPDPATAATLTLLATPTPAQALRPNPVAAMLSTPDPAAAATLTLLATPTPAPTTPAATVTGPLVIISERLGSQDGTEDPEAEMRRVFVHDIESDKYWVAFDYEHVAGKSAVQLTDTSLVVWSGGQIRRLGLDGSTAAVLFEHAEIRRMEVSPDGGKIAVVHDLPHTLLVLDVALGDELLRLTGASSILAPLGGTGSESRLVLGGWSADSLALGLVSGERTGILSLTGDLRVLPEDWSL